MKRPMALVTAAIICLAMSQARADTELPEPGGPPLEIGTAVPEYGIDSRITRIVYSDPAPPTAEQRAALGDVGDVLVSTGTISGIGWGGTPLVYRSATGSIVVPAPGGLDQLQRPYAYTTDVVWVWPAKGNAATCLVINAHGSPTNMVLGARNERLLGTPPRPTSRASREIGTLRDAQTLTVARAALTNGCAVFSANRWLRADGTPNAYFLDDTLDAEELAAVARPAGAGYDVTGPPWYLAEGEPAPSSLGKDVPTWRDVSRAAKLVHRRVAGASHHRVTIGLGTSAGGFLYTRMIGGIDEQVGKRTGGNHEVPYDPNTPYVIDYVIARVTTNMAERVDPDPRIGFAVEGVTLEVNTADAEPRPSPRIRFGEQWPYLATLAGRGISIADRCRLYEIRGLGHSWGSDERVDSGAGPAGPFIGAWIRNARERLLEGRPEPASRYGGFLDGDGALRFEQEAGSTNVIGYLDDPAIDTTTLTTAPVSAAVTAAFKLASPLLPRGGPPIRLPLFEHRVGGYEAGQFLMRLIPFAPEVLAARWPRFGDFRQAIAAAVESLEAGRYYDARVEHARATAERFRALFTHDPQAR